MVSGLVKHQQYDGFSRNEMGANLKGLKSNEIPKAPCKNIARKGEKEKCTHHIAWLRSLKTGKTVRKCMFSHVEADLKIICPHDANCNKRGKGCTFNHSGHREWLP